MALYEFGFGLSYTSFAPGGSLNVERLASALTAKPRADAEVGPRGNVELWESVLRFNTTVRNTGAVSGATVLQLHVVFPQDATPEGTPTQVLRGFGKVHLQPAEGGKVSFEVLRRDVSFWDVLSQFWIIPAGNFEFRVGFSSRDVVDVVSYAVLG